MLRDKKLLIADLGVIVFLVYLYLWRFSIFPRVAISLYLFLIATAFYLYLARVKAINHYAALIGVVVFCFCGSDLSLVFKFSKFPYPSALALFLGCFSFCSLNNKKGYLFYFSALLFFALACLTAALRLPLLLTSALRLLFNALLGLIAAYGMNNICLAAAENKEITCYRNIQRLLYRLWLFILLVALPIALILFIDLSKQLVPTTINYLVLLEIYLTWALVVSQIKNKETLDLSQVITIFLLVADTFSYWQPGL